MSTAKIGLGCVTFGREIDRENSFALLDEAQARGIEMLDTAAAYADGASETIIGEWLQSRKLGDDRPEVATKILPPFDAKMVRQRVEESLTRLGVSETDLLYLHSWDSTAEQVEVLAAFDELVRENMVRRLGVSNITMQSLEGVRQKQEAHSFSPFSAVQNNFNYAVRDLDEADRQRCRELGIRVITYSPLGAGFLTGKHRKGVEKGSRFDVIPGHQDVYFHDEAWARLDRLESVAAESGLSQAHLALAWVFRQPNIDSVLIGGRKVTHLDQAVRAREEIDPDILSRL